MPTQDRVPPQNIEAEQAVLGAILIKREVINEISQILQPEDFYRNAHRVVYLAMLELNEKNEAVDLITITEKLDQKNELEKCGGIAFVSSLANAVPTAANAVNHAKIVKEKSELRQLINAATDIAGMAYEGAEDIVEIMDQSERRILEVASRQNRGDFSPIGSVIMDTFDRLNVLYESKGGMTGLPTGFKDLDRITSGLQNSDLVLVAARPSMGKTAFTLNIATHVAIKEKKTVAFFSLEMSTDQLVQRMLCSEAGIDSQKLRSGEVSEESWMQLIDASDRIQNAPIFIADGSQTTVMDIRSRCRRLKAERGLDLIIIDYLQLMEGSGRRATSEANRQQEVSEISRSLKTLARELNVPIIALSQLSRGVESRTIKKPMLSDLRESGSLEQDADIVMFLYREDYYIPDTDKQNQTDVIIAKHRNGPIGSLTLFFQKECTRFRDLEVHRA